MPIPNWQPSGDECKQRVEIQLSPEQYLTVIVRHDGSITIDRFQQTPHVEGVTQELMELLTSVTINADNTVLVVIDQSDLDELAQGDTE